VGTEDLIVVIVIVIVLVLIACLFSALVPSLAFSGRASRRLRWWKGVTWEGLSGWRGSDLLGLSWRFRAG
jgi:hypothetical protein